MEPYKGEFDCLGPQALLVLMSIDRQMQELSNPATEGMSVEALGLYRHLYRLAATGMAKDLETSLELFKARSTHPDVLAALEAFKKIFPLAG